MSSNKPTVMYADYQKHFTTLSEIAMPRVTRAIGWLMTLSAIGLRDVSKHWWEFTAGSFEVRSESGEAYLGIDGEAIQMQTPLEFAIHPRGLRMFVPEGNLYEAERRRARDRTIRKVLDIALGR